MPKYTFMCLPEGKLPSGIASTLTAQLKSLAGLKCTIELAEAKDKRSNDANAYYWGVLIPAVREFRLEQGEACSPDDIHEDLLAVYSPLVERKALDGSIKMLPLRSSAMNKEQFFKYCMTIEVALADFGIILPAPPWQQP